MDWKILYRSLLLAVSLYSPLMQGSEIGDIFLDYDVIYDEDNRVEASSHNSWQNTAKSVAVLITKDDLLSQTKVNAEGYDFSDAITLNDFLEEESNKPLCNGEPFALQPSVASCTGFLVSADLLVTAGHCPEACDEESWVFDYQLNGASDKINVITHENVYQCKKVIKKKLTKNYDYALIQLDRPVIGREILKIDWNFDARLGSRVVVIGSPMGIPLKVADNAKILSANKSYFNANLDSFAGNSGSPVFDEQSGKVVGILTEGREDYILDKIEQCMRSNQVETSEIESHLPKIQAEKVSYFKELKNLIY